MKRKSDIPLGTAALIFSKHYYGVISRRLELLEIDRYYSILYFLEANNGCTQQHICNHLAIDKTAMVKVLDYLRKNGYVRRRKNPEDRREHLIELTDKGRERTTRIVESFEQLDKQLFCHMSEADRFKFTDTLNALTYQLSEMPATDLFFEYNRTGQKNASTKPTTKKKT